MNQTSTVSRKITTIPKALVTWGNGRHLLAAVIVLAARIVGASQFDFKAGGSWECVVDDWDIVPLAV
jgi:hypothetical protein